MKLSPDTIKILRNFSDINNTIFIRRGNNIVTVDPAKRIVADAKISESLPQDFAIYDLNQFLGVNSLLDSPELNFNDAKVTFKSANRSIDYFYADPSVVQDATTTRKKIPSVFDETKIVQRLTLTEDDMKSLTQASSVLGLTHISFVSDKSGSIEVVGHTLSNDTKGKVTLSVDGTSSAKSSNSMLFENLKVLPDAYDIEVCENVAHFVGKSTGVEYWIVMEAQ